MDPAEHNDYMDFICWVNRCLYPDDLTDDLVKLGMSEMTGVFYKIEWRRYQRDGKLNIAALWQNYNMSERESEPGMYLKLWIDKQYKTWEGYKK